MRNFFSCLYGDCKDCSFKTAAVFGCSKYGECSFCLARFSDFCDLCKYRKGE